MSAMMAGAAGFKLHEVTGTIKLELTVLQDWGTTPASIDRCLGFADEHDLGITIHTDTLNESGFVDDSVGAFKVACTLLSTGSRVDPFDC